MSGSHPFGYTLQDGASSRELLGQGMAHFMETNREIYGQFHPEIYARWLTDDPEALRAALVVEPSLEAHLHAMRLPALIYCGDRDNPTHERARRAAAAMPQATFLSLPGEDHASSVIASSLVVPHLRAFLEARVDSPARAPE